VQKNPDGIGYLTLFKKLDPLFKSKKLEYLNAVRPNMLITRIVNPLREANILLLKPGRDQGTIVKGNDWSNIEFILEPYINYFNTIYKG